jgi:hypothetical protein
MWHIHHISHLLTWPVAESGYSSIWGIKILISDVWFEEITI